MPPPTAGPAELRLSMVLRERRVRAGEPLFVTVSIVNTTDSVCTAALGNWAHEGPAGFVLVGQTGDTWGYRPHVGLVSSWGMLGPGLFGIKPHDSVYRRYVIWPQAFFRDRDKPTLDGGQYQFVGKIWQQWVREDGTPSHVPFMPAETIPVTIVPDSGRPAWLGPYRGLLDRWFDVRDGNWDRKAAAGETLLTVLHALPAGADSALLTLGHLLPDITDFVSHRPEAIIISESILARHPLGLLAEDLRGALPSLHDVRAESQTGDSLVSVFVSMYPRNTAALSYEEGRWLWYERIPTPPVMARFRRPFLGLPGPWGPWHEHKPIRLHPATK
jgi:hypothetical protein